MESGESPTRDLETRWGVPVNHDRTARAGRYDNDGVAATVAALRRAGATDRESAAAALIASRALAAGLTESAINAVLRRFPR